jgi:RNA polymerase sigma-70 factor (ECF subfamily)
MPAVAKQSDTTLDKREHFMLLYEPVHERLNRFVHSMVWNREDARDVIGDTVLKAFENFDKIEHKEAFLYYLFGIASNLAKHRSRRMKFWTAYEEHHEESLVSDSNDVYRKLEIETLYKAMSKLPEKQRETISLYEISGFSLAEIQDMQGGTLSGVKSRLVRARQELARLLEKENSISHNLQLKTSYLNSL